MLKPKLAVTYQKKRGAADLKPDFKEIIEEFKNIPEVPQTDEEIGCGELLRILPETWQNISWVLSNSINIMVNSQLKQRRNYEELKQHAINISLIVAEQLIETMDKNDDQVKKLGDKINHVDDMGQKRVRDAKQENIRICDTLDGKFDRIKIETDARIEKIERKISEMETKENTFQHIKQSIEELNKELMKKINLNSTISNKRFDEIIQNHLQKDNFIGPNFEYKSIIDFLQRKIPQIQELIRKGDDTVQSINFTLKNFQIKTKKELESVLPKRIQTIEEKQEQQQNKIYDIDSKLEIGLQKLYLEMNLQLKSMEESAENLKMKLDEAESDLKQKQKESTESIQKLINDLSQKDQQGEQKFEEFSIKFQQQVNTLDELVKNVDSNTNQNLQQFVQMLQQQTKKTKKDFDGVKSQIKEVEQACFKNTQQQIQKFQSNFKSQIQQNVQDSKQEDKENKQYDEEQNEQNDHQNKGDQIKENIQSLQEDIVQDKGMKEEIEKEKIKQEEKEDDEESIEIAMNFQSVSGNGVSKEEKQQIFTFIENSLKLTDEFQTKLKTIEENMKKLQSQYLEFQSNLSHEKSLDERNHSRQSHESKDIKILNMNIQESNLGTSQKKQDFKIDQLEKLNILKNTIHKGKASFVKSGGKDFTPDIQELRDKITQLQDQTKVDMDKALRKFISVYEIQEEHRKNIDKLKKQTSRLTKIEREKMRKKMQEETDLVNSIMNSSQESKIEDVILTEPKRKFNHNPSLTNLSKKMNGSKLNVKMNVSIEDNNIQNKLPSLASRVPLEVSMQELNEFKKIKSKKLSLVPPSHLTRQYFQSTSKTSLIQHPIYQEQQGPPFSSLNNTTKFLNTKPSQLNPQNNNAKTKKLHIIQFGSKLQPSTSFNNKNYDRILQIHQQMQNQYLNATNYTTMINQRQNFINKNYETDEFYRNAMPQEFQEYEDEINEFNNESPKKSRADTQQTFVFER